MPRKREVSRRNFLRGAAVLPAVPLVAKIRIPKEVEPEYDEVEPEYDEHDYPVFLDDQKYSGPSARIRYGVYDQQVPAGSTIGLMRSVYGVIWDLPADAEAWMNGVHMKEESYVLQSGDHIEFSRLFRKEKRAHSR